jgi:hypothetical protein
LSAVAPLGDETVAPLATKGAPPEKWLAPRALDAWT